MTNAWWFWLAISITGYVMCGALTCAVMLRIESYDDDIVSMTNSRMNFWLWPLLAAVSPMYLAYLVCVHTGPLVQLVARRLLNLNAIPDAVTRLTAPSRLKVPGRELR